MQKLDVIKERDRQLAGERPTSYAIRLHLELDKEDKVLGEELLDGRIVICTVFIRMKQTKNMIKHIAPISEVTVKELEDSIHFEGGFDELIERIPLCDILLMPGMDQNFDSWDFSNRRILKECKNHSN